MNERDHRYNTSEKGKARSIRYNRSEKGRARKSAYRSTAKGYGEALRHSLKRRERRLTRAEER